MREFSRMLCVVDDSDAGRRTLDCALWWARAHGGDVSVLRVHQPAIPGADASVPGVDATGVGPTAIAAASPVTTLPLAPEERAALMESLEAFVAGSRTDGVQIEVLLDEAVSVADAVRARAEALACDLIVMSVTAGEAADAQSVVGRDTAAVLRDPGCAVLCVPGPAAGTADWRAGGLHAVVCPVSFSDTSTQALMLAVELTAQATAHLTVLHVVELSEVAASAYDFDAYRDARIEPACDQLTSLVVEMVGNQTAVEEIVVVGAPDAEILKTARDADAELIVLGAAATTPGTGTTLDKVVREARCPVLVTPKAPLAAVLNEPVLTAMA
jgi:nucleotide-binding universal stress UspA family protein